MFTVDIAPGQVLKIASMYLAKHEDQIEGIFKSAKPEKASDMPSADIRVMRTVKAFKGQTLKDLADSYQSTDMLPAMILINEVPASHLFEAGELVKVIEKQKMRF